MLQQLCNKISIFLLQIKQAFAVSFGHSKVNHFMANFEWPYDTFAQYIEPISKYCFNKLIFERFLTHKLTLSSTGLFSHPFLSHIIKKLHVSAATVPFGHSCPSSAQNECSIVSNICFQHFSVHIWDGDVPSRSWSPESLLTKIWPFLKN